MHKLIGVPRTFGRDCSYIAHIASPYRFKGWNGHFGYRFEYVFEVSVFRNHKYAHYRDTAHFSTRKSNLSKCFALNDKT